MGWGYFKTTQDGSKLFFPWAARGAGYVIASEQDYQRLRQQIKLYNRVHLAILVAVAIAAEFFTKIGPAVIIIIGGFLSEKVYTAWVRRLLPRLRLSDEKLSHREVWAGTLKALKPIGPWTVPDPSVASSRTVSD